MAKEPIQRIRILKQKFGRVAEFDKNLEKIEVKKVPLKGVTKLSSKDLSEVFTNDANFRQTVLFKARNDVKKSLWIEAGFSTGMFSNELANSLIPNPKIENIIGKSDDYIIAYNDCYKKEANKLQNSYARIGCCSKALFLPL